MGDVFEKFGERLAASVDATDLHGALAEIARALDLPLFAYLLCSPPLNRRAELISTYPNSWTSHYLRNRYEAVDPVIEQALRDRKIFCWGTIDRDLDLSASQKQLMDEAGQFGIRCGFTIPLHDQQGRFAALTFASDEKQPPFFKLVERYEYALRLLAVFFHIHARERLMIGQTQDGVYLTHRERQCLDWAHRGKSAWEIGQILGISQRTVSFHLENAKKKYGVRTTTQAAIRFAVSRRAGGR